MPIASHFPVEPPPDRFPCRLHAASTRKAAWCSSTWTARAFQESQITYSKRSPLSEKVVNQMQALNKADFTQANIRLTLLETRKRAAMSGHSTGQSRLILLLAQGSRALAQRHRRSRAGSGQRGRLGAAAVLSTPRARPHCSPRTSQATRTPTGTQRQTEAWGTLLHYGCTSGKDHAED